VDDREKSDKGMRALAAFAQAIGSPETRRAFEKNERTLEQILREKDASADDLPGSVRAFLDDLSAEEMRLLAHFQATMVEAGFYEEVASDELQSVWTLAKF
jgi:hypothetical protein